jgi:hypothetical protein
MYNSCHDAYSEISSCPKQAKIFLEAINYCIKRNLVIVMDNKEDLVITGFSANRKHIRLLK